MLKKGIKLTKVFVLLLSIWLISNGISIYNYSKLSSTIHADVAIVLGAGTSNGQLSLVFKERVNHAIYLYQTNQIEKIIITGGFGHKQIQSDSQIARVYANQNGIPLQDILIEEKSTITYENLLFAQDIMNLNDLQSALIVSDPFHMKRAMMMCEKLGINAATSPTPTSKYQTWQTKFPFLVYESFFYTIDFCLGHL